MKKVLTITALLICCWAQAVKAQSNNTGTTVIIGFDLYDNKNLYGLLQSEVNGVITVKMFDDNTTCVIDDKGNILEGENYIKQNKPGKPVLFIQLYESKKKIVNPDLDMNKNLGPFMLVETADGNLVFGSADYVKAEQKFVFRSKPLSKVVVLKSVSSKWQVTGSEDSRVKAGSSLAGLYLYNSNTRRFYTRK